jgi:ArsR family transcriptional regulator, lead/cadmium/zinc/bismuth-responsive transcriptional repressor
MSTRSYVSGARTLEQLKARLLDDASVADLAETFKVLGDTTRVRILDALARVEVPVCDLARLLGLTQSAVSHQLRLLRGMRLVKSRRAGRHIYYMADDHHIVGLFEQGLEHVQERGSVAPPRAWSAPAPARPPARAGRAEAAEERTRSRPTSAGRGRRA